MPDKRKRIEAKFITGLAPRRPGGDGAHLSNQPVAQMLIGHGYDIHRLQSGGKLTLGGVIVSQDMSPIAHSDGDVIFHCIVDAILGALGLGDIGQHFPDSDDSLRGMESWKFLDQTLPKMKRFGYSVSNLDLTLLLEKPKIAPHRRGIVESIQKLVGSAATVNLKAGTNEGCDAVGRGEAVACHCVVLLTRNA